VLTLAAERACTNVVVIARNGLARPKIAAVIEEEICIGCAIIAPNRIPRTCIMSFRSFWIRVFRSFFFPSWITLFSTCSRSKQRFVLTLAAERACTNVVVIARNGLARPKIAAVIEEEICIGWAVVAPNRILRTWIMSFRSFWIRVLRSLFSPSWIIPFSSRSGSKQRFVLTLAAERACTNVVVLPGIGWHVQKSRQSLWKRSI